MSNILKFMGATAIPTPPGQQAYTTPGTYSWVCPVGVNSVSVVCIGGAGGGSNRLYGSGSAGGGLGYKNNFTVTPGASYTVVVGAEGAYTGSVGQSSSFNSTTCIGRGSGYGSASGDVGGTFVGDGGGNGGNGGGASGGPGAGGAGGYAGNGGNGGAALGDGTAGAGGGGGGGGGSNGGTYFGAGGGGVGILGQGSSGSAGTGGTIGTGGGAGSSGTAGGVGNTGSPTGAAGGAYGGGAVFNGTGGTGAVRIIWPGAERQFPSTRTADE